MIMYYILCGIVGCIVGCLAHGIFSRIRIGRAKKMAKSILDDARKNAENIKKEIAIQAREEAYKQQAEFDKEVRERRAEMKQREERIIAKEGGLEEKLDMVEKRESILAEETKKLETKTTSFIEKDKNLAALEEEYQKRLSDISGISVDEAKDRFFEQIRQEAEHEAILIARNIKNDAREQAEKKAREIMTYAMERCAADHVAETAVTTVFLPNDDLKGRIIGREGRNIRAFEAATGVELIVDDTPEAIIVSGFDPIRREVARLALERLIQDGRINTARIEESVARARTTLESLIRETGENAAMELNVHGLHPGEIKLLGKLKYRSSFGQNCLQHSKEVAFLAGVMAAEIGEDEKMTRRAGLIHDLGKAIDKEVEGNHIEISVELARKYNEHPQIIHAIATHHQQGEPQSALAAIVQTADRLSAARPGARLDTLESYVKRLGRLETIADSFNGVEKSHALQAGREIRVIVEPGEIDDVEIYRLAEGISEKIRNELEFPGQIQVTVVRETRAIKYAR